MSMKQEKCYQGIEINTVVEVNDELKILSLNIRKLWGGFILKSENFPNDVTIKKEEDDVKGFEIQVEGSCP